MAQGYIYVPALEFIVKVNQQTGEEYALQPDGDTFKWVKIPPVVEGRVEIPRVELVRGN